jgi:hypothetical protein
MLCIGCFIAAGVLSNYTPLFVLLCTLVFAVPVTCFFLSDRLTGRLGLVTCAVVMVACLYYSVTAFRSSPANSSQRIQAIYGFTGFLFAGIVVSPLILVNWQSWRPTRYR